MNLSKEYTTEINLPLDYTRLDPDKIIRDTPQKNIYFTIKGTGFELITLNLKKKQIAFDLKKIRQKENDEYYLLSRDHFSDIQKQLPSGLKLTEILQDTIFINISQLKTKKVPIKPNINISYKKGYDLAEPYLLKPDSLVLSGTKENLSAIKEISTNYIEINELSEDITRKLKLEIPKNLKASHDNTFFKLRVDKFTEGKIETQIKIRNISKGESIVIFPKKVEITYKVGLQNFQQINENSFEVFCDLQHAKHNNLSYMVPEVKIKTNLVSAVRIIPKKIDFLIQK